MPSITNHQTHIRFVWIYAQFVQFSMTSVIFCFGQMQMSFSFIQSIEISTN